MAIAAILAPLLIAVAIQTLPTFANLAATTLAPEILAELDLPGGGLTIYVGLLYAMATIASFVAAGLVMKYGPVRSSQVALFGYAFGLATVFMFPTVASFVLAAILFGIAYTMPIPAGAQILISSTPPHLRNTLFGIRQMGVPLGGLFAGILFPLIEAEMGWRWAFAMTAVACLLLGLGLQAYRRRYDGERQPALLLLRGGSHGPVAVLRASPALRRLCFVGVIFAGTEVTAVTNIVLFLDRDFSWSLKHAGYGLSALSLGGALGRLFWGIVADRLKNRLALLGLLGLGMAASMAALAFKSEAGPMFVYGSAFLVGFTAGGWTGVGVAESARLAGSAGPVAGTAALTLFMFLGVVTLPLGAGAALALGAAYPYVFAGVGLLAGFGGLMLLLAPSETKTISPRSGIPWTPLILTMLTQAAATMAAYTLSTASPHIAPDLGVENEDVAQLVAIIYLMGALSAMTIPPFIHRYGGLAISMVICSMTVVMLAISSMATSIIMLSAAAVALGCIYGATAPSSSHVLAPLAPPHRRNIIFSIRQIGVPLGGILGGVLVPPLILLGGWRAAFQAQLVFAMLLFMALYLVRHRYDRNRDRQRRVFEFGGPRRMLQLLRDLPELRPLAILSFVYSGAQLCFGTFLVTQLVRVFGDSAYAFASAIALVAFQLSGITTRIILGIIADSMISARTLLAAQGLIMAAAAVAAANYGADWPLWLVLVNCAVAGATASGYTGLAFAEFARIGGVARTAETTGLGAAVMFSGVAVMAPLFRLGIDVFDGYRVPYLVVAVLAFLTAIM
ncbi:MAG: MFS transporter, partial [Alphaproteobacteria bacterium]